VSSFQSSPAYNPSLSDVLPAPSPGVESPKGNTGDNLTSSIKCDWLNVVFPAGEVLVVAASLVARLGSYTLREIGMHGYHCSIRWESGAFIAWTDGRPEALLSLSGGACALVGPSDLLGLIQFTASLGAHCTRLDAAFDDHDRLASMDDVHNAALAKNVLGFRRYDPRRPRSILSGELEGDSAYFGRRGRDGSGTFIRVYDKALESDGQVNAIRWEAEFSGDRADLVYRDLAACETLEQFTRVLAAAVGGSISFIDRDESAHGHIDRMRVLPWWEKIVRMLGQVRYRVVRVKPKLQQSLEFVVRQVGPTLAKIVAAVDHVCGLGSECLRAIVSKAERSIDLDDIRGRAAGELSLGYVLECLDGVGGGGRGVRQAKLGSAAAAAVWW
jgi:DNA relaxase NicK